ncbi:MAG: hypothetical protein DRG34_04860 [Deltaproteobacteria bacterium]|nr:MAG: hypothetical protein DRG34_04860 [Deltaproteobacteria bacterium]
MVGLQIGGSSYYHYSSHLTCSSHVKRRAGLRTRHEKYIQITKAQNLKQRKKELEELENYGIMNCSRFEQFRSVDCIIFKFPDP